MKPIVHALNSAKKFGGQPSDYLPLHDFLDSSKSSHGTNRHRIVLHSSFGVFVLEKVFGHTITNSDGRAVHVRDVGEQHVVEDLGFIPDLSDWVRNLPLEPWMCGAAIGHPELRPNSPTVKKPAKTPRKRAPAVTDKEAAFD